MLHELILILTQFGGGPGDPANNAVRFLLAAFFWGTLLLVSFRMWRGTKDRQHLFFAIAAMVGISRELFMFVAEYGSFRGHVSFPVLFRYYPPYEHAVTMFSVILMGYAFLRYYLDFAKFSRVYLIACSAVTFLLYLITAPLWIKFLDAAMHLHPQAPYTGAFFDHFWGEIAFRTSAVCIYGILLGAFCYARTQKQIVPWPAVVAFLYFFLDDALQLFNIALSGRYTPELAPLRHCLHLWGITLLVGVYWWDINNRVGKLQEVRNRIFNLTPDILGIADLSGKISVLSPACEAILGYRPEELVGAHLQDLGFPSPATTLNSEPRNTTAEDDCIYHTISGEARWIHWKFQVVEEQDQVYFVISDLTHRKFAELEREEMSRKLAASNKELQHFAYIASHDLQEPLRTITSFIQLLAKRYKGKLDSDADDFIGFITDGAKRMQQLISDLLSYSRVDSKGKDFADFDCEAVLARTIDNLRQAITESGAMITHDPLPVMYGDDIQISQLFQNLIGNAIKFRGSDAVAIHVGVTEKPEEWEISVRDNGIGIEPEFFERIFEIFQCLHPRDQYPGTGIGLAICKKIVERHNGKISVASEPGNGATFTFTISKRQLADIGL